MAPIIVPLPMTKDSRWNPERQENKTLVPMVASSSLQDAEYCYGGHQFGGSGIFEMSPKDTNALGPNYIYRTSIDVGQTDFTYEDVCMILNNMEEEFCGDRYHLLRKNCNHFSHAFIEILCGASLPKWINRLAVRGLQASAFTKSDDFWCLEKDIKGHVSEVSSKKNDTRPLF
ncbi:unnamed protein product [Dibothriocephalus latus]|uniref:PPPDE domain-containing protein n=1 Tax=Dibothriocephalus latus TaxID=60516 RepID=A0A3P7NWZ1_DIBLA|nr:unnamed protein product [Dibothriocephalus latus]